MQVSKLPDHALLIAPTYMHGILRKQLLEDASGRIGIQLCSLDSFLSNRLHEDSIEELDVLVAYHQILAQMDLQIYASIAARLDFSKQCLQFIKEMKFYHIGIADLPTITSAQQEIKKILAQLYTIRDAQDQQNEALQEVINSSLNHVYIYDYYHDAKAEHILMKLCEQGAHRILLPETLQTKLFYHAINKRKEVDSFAQRIITQNQKAQDLNIVVCDPSYKALISQVFHRYQIPFTILKQSKTSILTQRFLCLLKYYMEPSTPHLLKLLDTNVFSFPYLHEFIEYVQVFDRDVYIPFLYLREQASISEIIDEREIKRLAHLEEHAEACREMIAPYLDQLLHADTIRDVLLVTNQIASLNIKANDTKQLHTLKEIHQRLNLLEPYLKTKTDFVFAIDVLEEIKESANSKQLHGVLVSDLDAILPPRKECVILGCTQSSYPAIPVKNGIFDEAYVSLLSTYPSRKYRYDLHMKQLSHFLQTSEQLYASYPLGSYDGKGYEAALEMETFIGDKASACHLQENYLPYQRNETLYEDTAKQMFLKDNILSGSISSLERYQRCPFSYFLKYGLRIHEPIDYQFSPSKIGTLAHSILENLVQKYGKTYVDATMLEIDQMITQELQGMANVYPSFQTQLNITKQRMLAGIAKNMEYLKELEEHAHLNPYISEHEFWYDIALHDAHTLKLHGYIDRIDASTGFLRVLDYKSSSKSLSAQDVFAGIQLQLITYSIVAKKELQKDVLGAHYYSLKNENIAIAAGKMKRRPVQYLPLGSEEYEQQWLSSKRLTGWMMSEDADILDDDGSHVYGLRQNKDGEIKARNVYDLNVLTKHFHTMYEKIGASILSGNIACTPNEDACLFCPYPEICRFHGRPRAVAQLVEIDDTIYKGGARTDANME